MQVSHTPAAVSAAFDDPNLIAYAGLLPVLRLAERCGLSRLVAEKVKLTGAKNGAGAAADAKVTSIMGGMAAGADSIDDLHVLRHGAMPAAFAGARAPSTLGTFLRAFTHGHTLQLHAVHRRFLAALAAHTPLLPGSGEKAFIDVDSTHKRVYGRAKQGAEYGRFKGIRTLHPLLATICTPQSRPVIATVRMRRGKAADSRGAPKFVSEALATAVEAGCTGTRILRADSQFYNAGVISACRRAGAHFSITCGQLRPMRVRDHTVAGEAPAVEKADASDPSHIAVPYFGAVTPAVALGERVAAGATIATIEAMKMEASITAPFDGTPQRIAVNGTQLIESGGLLLVLGKAD
ncbi:transposase [Streptomyces sp. NPDC002346]